MAVSTNERPYESSVLGKDCTGESPEKIDKADLNNYNEDVRLHKINKDLPAKKYSLGGHIFVPLEQPLPTVKV